MNRNQAKKFYPILQAFAEEEAIECRTKLSALTDVLRYFRDNGELKKAYEIQKGSLTNMANSPWAKLVIGMLTSKVQEDKVA